jgi:hypothetical protein
MGKFKKGESGNPNGRPEGSKNQRTKEWEVLGEAITSMHSERYNQLLQDLWNSGDIDDQLKAAELYHKTLEYFKPKLNRTTLTGDSDQPLIVVKGADKI